MPTPKSLQETLTGRKSLLCFVTGGDPPIDQLPSILHALVEGGADVIEIGLPFSDPIADGPTIQASSQRALDAGVTVSSIFETVRNARVGVPVVAMGYTNTAMRIGFSEFASQAADAGFSGVILSDLAADDSAEWVEAASSNELDTIFLAAPTSTDERLQLVADASTGFIYCVSRTGVTGADSKAAPEAAETVARIRKFSNLPVCVGFGISRAEHVHEIWKAADGAVVGSYIVDFLHERWENGTGKDALVDTIRTLKGPS